MIFENGKLKNLFTMTDDELEEHRKLRIDTYANIAAKIQFMPTEILLNINDLIENFNAYRIHAVYGTSDDDGFGGSKKTGRPWGSNG